MAPLRELPEHSVPTPEPGGQEDVKMGEGDRNGDGGGATDAKSKDTTLADASTNKHASSKPLFREPDFGVDGASDLKKEDFPPGEDVLSPTATRA
jgi:hypothetical protein